jgi:phospho-N-acetylmuramoyl-pentapeptide-transferase
VGVSFYGYGASAAFCAAIAGACAGFLLYNHYPAKLFMGDTGSLALGGAIAAAAILMNIELIIPIAGGIYVAEAASVLIQVFVFKTQNGRRFFRMAPLHHHFEELGWSETKIVERFFILSILFSGFALVLLKFA